MKIALHGASGRMGAAIIRLATQAGDVSIVGAACGPGDPAVGRDVGEVAGVGALGVECTPDVAASLLGADVVIDFTVAAAVKPLLLLAAQYQVAVVSGTTNLDAATRAALAQAADSIPVLWAPNMSLGVQVLAEIVEEAVRRLGSGFDVEIVEVHHRRKVDAPSGTAVRLAQAVEQARSGVRRVSGREGEVGARTQAEMAVMALRGGDVVGDHVVHLLGDGERLELTHRATNRDVFAHGALRAARFVRGRAPGSYSIADVLSG